jgi:3-phenylpropionate/trans-cinnamate dioxygenase ferredoxin component
MADIDGWQYVAALADLSEGTAYPAKLGDTPIALYRLDGRLHAIDDVCTHEFALLSQGFVEGGMIECPLHQACFDIATGRCLSPPAMVDLRVYAVRIDGNDVYVRPADSAQC